MHMRRNVIALASSALAMTSSLIMALNFKAAAAQMRVQTNWNRVGPRTRKTGWTYPHSSARQRVRYARQIAAGQIRN